jgi:hypothetical protein
MRSFLDLSSLVQKEWSFDPQGSVYSNRSLAPQQAAENALSPGLKIPAADGFESSILKEVIYSNRSLVP